jgi:SAM-dependent methyltransferase
MGESAAKVRQRFDAISSVYDETRVPLTDEALDTAARVLSKDGCRLILEVGVGTGRIAKPLQARGFDVVGVDFSPGMLSAARQKGVASLVLGDANSLPLRDKSVDAALLAHVLHLLEEPAETFGKLARVARNEIVAFVRDRSVAPSPSGPDGPGSLGEAFRTTAEEMGYQHPGGLMDWRARFKGETEFLEWFPPSELTTVQDITVTTTLGERLSAFEKRIYGPTPGVTDEVFRKVMERIRSSADLGKEVRYRRVEQMAVWRLPH